jgi:hypothetical protein
VHPDRHLHPVLPQPDPHPELVVDGPVRRAFDVRAGCAECPRDGHADRHTRRVRFGGRYAVRGQPVAHGEPVSVTVAVTDAA